MLSCNCLARGQPFCRRASNRANMRVASADIDFVFKRRVQAAKVTARNLLFFTVCAAPLFCHVSSSSILSASHPISAVKTNFSSVIDMICMCPAPCKLLHRRQLVKVKGRITQTVPAFCFLLPSLPILLPSVVRASESRAAPAVKHPTRGSLGVHDGR